MLHWGFYDSVSDNFRIGNERDEEEENANERNTKKTEKHTFEFMLRLPIRD